MNKLDIFVKMLSGNFDNQEQYDSLKDQDENFPYCRHVNTVCNNKIIDLDPDFKGVFLVEESYYTAKGSTHASSHLFLFTEEDGGIKLTSYEVPEGYNKNDFTYDKMKDVKLADLKLSAKFPPLPIISPGRAVQTVIVMSFIVRSITILDMLAFDRRVLRYLRIFMSSTKVSPNLFPPHQLESQPLMIPKRLLIGLTFCPI